MSNLQGETEGAMLAPLPAPIALTPEEAKRVAAGVANTGGSTSTTATTGYYPPTKPS